MTAPATAEVKKTWRGAPRGTMVRRSRHLWRWLLSGLALCLIGLAVYLAWPRRLSRPVLLILTSDREERTLPLVPYAEGDSQALFDWARAAKVPARQAQLMEVDTPDSFVRRLARDDDATKRLTFSLGEKGSSSFLGPTDTLVLYIKGHGLAIDVSDGERPDMRPLVVKSLSERDLAGAWFRDPGLTIDVSELLRELAQFSEMKKLIILDAVHLNYDPRLGMLVNAFPQAVKNTIENLPSRRNLWVLVGQSDGQRAVGLPGAGRSVLVDSLASLLERKPGDSVGVELGSLVTKVQSRIDEQNQ